MNTSTLRPLPFTALTVAVLLAVPAFGQSLVPAPITPPTTPAAPTPGLAATPALPAAPEQAPIRLQEDLSTCPLPHGDLILPLPGTLEATNGDMLKLSDGLLHPIPLNNGHPIPPAQLPAFIQKNQTADIAYLDADHGTLWALSGRISELGASLLSDVAALSADKPLSPPFELAGDDRHPAGLFKNVEEGRTYLIQTTNGNFALVRVVEKANVGLHIQYVYQPNGTAQFTVPEAPMAAIPVVPLTSPPPPQQPALAAAPDAAAPNGMALPSATLAVTPAGDFTLPPAAPQPAQPAAQRQTDLLPAPTIAPAAPPKSITGMTIRIGDAPAGAAAPTGAVESPVEANLRQRSDLIRRRLETLSPNSPASLETKSQAIADLGSLHAAEAADALASQISFLDARRKKGAGDLSPESLHPAYAALLKLGRPATDASLKALRALNPAEQPASADDYMSSPDYRARLLANVIRAVEGDDVADFILAREAARTPDPQKRALLEKLASNKP
jgi:hypothetical protein